MMTTRFLIVCHEKIDIAFQTLNSHQRHPMLDHNGFDPTPPDFDENCGANRPTQIQVKLQIYSFLFQVVANWKVSKVEKNQHFWAHLVMFKTSYLYCLETEQDAPGSVRKRVTCAFFCVDSFSCHFTKCGSVHKLVLQSTIPKKETLRCFKRNILFKILSSTRTKKLFWDGHGIRRYGLFYTTGQGHFDLFPVHQKFMSWETIVTQKNDPATVRQSMKNKQRSF